MDSREIFHPAGKYEKLLSHIQQLIDNKGKGELARLLHRWLARRRRKLSTLPHLIPPESQL
ncbi:hypothetical protein [Massilia rubra]|uniref:Uncharacterized protein n=1 Tax=Massilia rubra TaxID=2607910 RepID=A0ABX0LVM7_9BURK|nr:hypothetical protein [Massilia rubra]NHZ35932.1 hypothetical protein [Massilia rubra]